MLFSTQTIIMLNGICAKAIALTINISSIGTINAHMLKQSMGNSFKYCRNLLTYIYIGYPFYGH